MSEFDGDFSDVASHDGERFSDTASASNETPAMLPVQAAPPQPAPELDLAGEWELASDAPETDAQWEVLDVEITAVTAMSITVKVREGESEKRMRPMFQTGTMPTALRLEPIDRPNRSTQARRTASVHAT